MGRNCLDFDVCPFHVCLHFLGEKLLLTVLGLKKKVSWPDFFAVDCSTVCRVLLDEVLSYTFIWERRNEDLYAA